MKLMRILVAAGLGLTVAACAEVETTTRNAPFETVPAVDASPTSQQTARLTGTTGQIAQSPVTVKSITVDVPRSLVVSEANRYIPRGDIVWREDPPGDRYVQVQKIVQDALQRGVRSMNGPVDVNLEVQMVKFHALTEKARYTTGGVHAITFNLAIKSADTGQLLVPVRQVRADLKAYGGQQAINAEAQGITQKVRITDHLAKVIQQELTNPEGYKNAELGVIQLLNQM